MTWTPNTPPASAWSNAPAASDGWSPSSPADVEWDSELLTTTVRITEDGVLRLIEDESRGDFRIIEATTEVAWTKETIASDTWA